MGNYFIETYTKEGQQHFDAIIFDTSEEDNPLTRHIVSRFEQHMNGRSSEYFTMASTKGLCELMEEFTTLYKATPTASMPKASKTMVFRIPAQHYERLKANYD